MRAKYLLITTAALSFILLIATVEPFKKTSNMIEDFCKESAPVNEIQSNTQSLKNIFVDTEVPLKRLTYFGLSNTPIEKLYIKNSPNFSSSIQEITNQKISDDWNYVEISIAGADDRHEGCKNPEKGMIRLLAGRYNEYQCLNFKEANEDVIKTATPITIRTESNKSGKEWTQQNYILIRNHLVFRSALFSNGSTTDEAGGKHLGFCQ